MADVAVVRDRLSTYHGTRVPLSMARFVAWLAADPLHAEQLEARAYLLPAHDLDVADPAAPLPERPTLRYHAEPPEFMAIARTGTDGEQLGVIELAPELARDELPFVTFFPMEFEAAVCALGDELAPALSMFLAYPSEQGPKPLALPGLFDGVQPPSVWNGYAPHAEAAPPGYRFVATADRAGVLAPASAFADGVASIGYHPPPPVAADALERAERLLHEGYPGSALALAREVRAADGDPADVARACEIWLRAALQLGRPWHAAMVQELVDDYEGRDESSVTLFSSGPILSAVVFETDDEDTPDGEPER